MKTRKDIISEVHADLELAKKDVEATIHKYEEKLVEALKEGHDVLLHGFGKLELRQRSARQGRNPQTGEPIEIPAQQSVGLKPSSNLKNAVNGTETE